MKISVSYGDRTYGNSQPSQATEVRIYGSQTKVHINIGFKKPKLGRSWDWMSAGSVGGADLELPLDDAKALARAILDFAAALPTHDPMQESMNALVRMREGNKPVVKVVRKPYKFV